MQVVKKPAHVKKVLHWPFKAYCKRLSYMQKHKFVPVGIYALSAFEQSNRFDAFDFQDLGHEYIFFFFFFSE
jgi:hypothetical protein